MEQINFTLQNNSSPNVFKFNCNRESANYCCCISPIYSAIQILITTSSYKNDNICAPFQFNSMQFKAYFDVLLLTHYSSSKCIHEEF